MCLIIVCTTKLLKYRYIIDDLSFKETLFNSLKIFLNFKFPKVYIKLELYIKRKFFSNIIHFDTIHLMQSSHLLIVQVFNKKK